MPRCHKIYPNCIWQVPSEWHTLGFYLALLTKVYWNYATHIVTVCVTPISPKTSKLDLTDKSNLQVFFSSKAMASLYHLLCYHSFTSTDPLHEELLAYLPTPFHPLSWRLRQSSEMALLKAYPYSKSRSTGPNEHLDEDNPTGSRPSLQEAHDVNKNWSRNNPNH